MFRKAYTMIKVHTVLSSMVPNPTELQDLNLFLVIKSLLIIGFYFGNRFKINLWNY